MTKTFLKDLIERVVKTFGEVMLGFLGADQLLTDVNWNVALQTSGMACLAAILVSLGSFKLTDNGTASLVKEIVAEDEPGRHAVDR